MIKFFTLSTLLFFCFTVQAQEKVTLNGYVKDSGNGEELIGVTVYIPALKAGTVTNDYGFYALTVPKGSYEVHYSYIGFEEQIVTIDLQANVSRNINLLMEPENLQEVVVEETPLDENITSVQMSKNTINMTQVRKLPALLGEVDIIKSVQMLPGVITAGEGTSAFFVRGGSADQNLILIDEAPIYDPSHVFGLFSVFNADVIKDSELYRGGIPARFGGRLSSILDVRTKDGNNKEYHTTAGIGTLASRLMVEGPIVKDKSSFIVSARRSYLDLFLRAANKNSLVNFYDINAKVNLKGNNKNRYFLAFYTGRDNFSLENQFGFGWGNMVGTFRWNHLFNDRLFMNTSVIASQFDYKLEIKDPIQGFDWVSNLQELNIKNDLSYSLNTNNELTFGYHVAGRQFEPGTINPNSDQAFIKHFELQHKYALDHGIYVSNQQKVSDKVSLDYGVRLSIFQNIGAGDVILYKDPQDNIKHEQIGTRHYNSWETIKAYVNLEPRAGLRYAFAETQSLKLSYNRMVQNTHLMASGTVPVPFNTWNPSDYYLKPQLADQFAGGYFRNFKNNMYEFSLETYYKDITNVTDFADNAQLFFNENLSTEFRQGHSWSYGSEVMLNKKEGKLIGMASYTWSKTQRHIAGVNKGNVFYANSDRRNVVNLQAAYDLDAKWTFGATFTYSTGRPITLPAGKYDFGPYRVDVIPERNSIRLPDMHRLDFSVTLNPRKNERRRWKSQYILSIYNVYNRHNPFTVYTRNKQDENGDPIGNNEKEARMVYLFPILPSLTYNVKF